MMWAGKPPKRPPVDGKRTVRRFAFWPTTVDLDEDPPVVVWLEWYYCYQEIVHGGYSGPEWRTLARYSGMPV